MPVEIESGSEGRTGAIGELLAGLLGEGDVLCLEGDLGTGKTVLARGVARGLGYQGPVQSPTFTIIHTYPGIRLCHVDAYRLGGPDDLTAAGIEEYLEGGWICAVEWAEKVRAALPSELFTVRISFGRGDADRVLQIDVPRGAESLAELLGASP